MVKAVHAKNPDTGRWVTFSGGTLQDGTVVQPVVPDDWEVWTGAEPPQNPIEKDLNQTLEEKFLGMLPKHDGKVYLTDDVVDAVLSAKLKVAEANKLGRTDFARKALSALRKKLPAEMVGDLDTIVGMIPAQA